MSLDRELAVKIISQLTLLADGKLVFVFDRIVINCLQSVSCQLTDIDPNKYHISKETFGERLLTNMISKSSDERFVKWSRYKTNQLFQSHLLKILSSNGVVTFSVNPSTSTYKKMMCIEGTIDDEKELPQPFKLLFFIPFLKVCIISIFISSFLLLYEIFYSQVVEKLIHN